jgi:4-hydroxy-2-oxoheptanedioate aldolase
MKMLTAALSMAVVGGLTLTALAARPAGQGDRPSGTNGGRLNHVIEKLERGETVIGTFPGQAIGSIATARQLGSSNNDFIMFDLQYGTFDVGPIQHSLFAMINKADLVKRRSLVPLPTPMARIPEWTHENPDFAAKQLLDIGLFGVMFPHIESRQQAEQAVTSMRYPHRAGASFERPGSTRNDPVEAFWYWGVSKEEYLQRADVWPLNPRGELLAVLQIESDPGVKHLDEILSTPGVGALLIGPSHLSQSLGEAGAKSPKTEAAVQTIVKACVAKRVPCAYPIVEDTQERAKAEIARRQSEGFRMLTVNVNGRAAGAP